MIYNEDCLDTLNRNLEYDYIITSPPDFDEIGADTKNIQPYIQFLKERFEKFNPLATFLLLIWILFFTVLNFTVLT